MTKQRAFSTLIALAISCNLEAKADSMNDTTPQPPLKPDISYISKALDISRSVLNSLKSVKVLVESITPAKSDERRSPTLTKSLIIPTAPQFLSKNSEPKMFEMGMNMPLSQKFSWGAEVAVGKNKTNLVPEAPKKRPLAGLRLKPDLYTFQISLKYKI